MSNGRHEYSYMYVNVEKYERICTRLLTQDIVHWGKDEKKKKGRDVSKIVYCKSQKHTSLQRRRNMEEFAS